MRLAALQIWIGWLGVVLLGCGDAGDAISGGSAGTGGSAGANAGPTTITTTSTAAGGGGDGAAAAGSGGTLGVEGAQHAGNGGTLGSALYAGNGGTLGAAGMMRAGSGGTLGDAGIAGSGSPADAATPDAGLPAKITVWIAGDSTVAKGETPCPVGWGASFASHFNPGVAVVNSAVGGRSVRTWLYNVGTTLDSSGECVLAKGANGEPTVQAHWQAMLDGMHPGDFLFIQFGINDSSATCDRHVGLDAFKTSYGMMAKAAKARGAQPIFLTPVSAISCSGTTARATRGGFVTATIDAGASNDVPVIDLHQRSIDLYNRMHFCPIPGGDVSASTTGPVGDFFCDDHTHFSPSGAPQIADLVVEALRDQKLELAAYLK